MQILPAVQPLSKLVRAVIFGISAASIFVPIALVGMQNDGSANPAGSNRGTVPRIVAKAELPSVEPTAFISLAPQNARAFNAQVPFSTAPNPAAKPYHLQATDPADFIRATDCLAAAVIYEAGDDPVGQRAVAQVVLNRMRHPAFPKTVCGVVFQGAERRTGCQFTFTCDGALARRYATPAWSRAQKLAEGFLKGEIEPRVGMATHYHTDWVVPYWSASLDKISEINTHLFFRWTGWWGTPPAFRGNHAGTEPVIAQLAALSVAHVKDGMAADQSLIEVAALELPAADIVTALPMEYDTNSFMTVLDPAQSPATYAAAASRICGDRPYCKLLAWTDRADLPSALPMPPSKLEKMAFSFLRDRARAFERVQWDCARFVRRDAAQCLKHDEKLSQDQIQAKPVGLSNVGEKLAGTHRAVTARQD